MAAQPRPDDLAQLRATVTILQARLTRVEQRRRLPRRVLPLTLAGLLVALMPLAILPGLTHYNIFMSPLLAAVALDFIDGQIPAQ